MLQTPTVEQLCVRTLRRNAERMAAYSRAPAEGRSSIQSMVAASAVHRNDERTRIQPVGDCGQVRLGKYTRAAEVHNKAAASSRIGATTGTPWWMIESGVINLEAASTVNVRQFTHRKANRTNITSS